MSAYPTVLRLFEAERSMTSAVKWLHKHAESLFAQINNPCDHRLMRGVSSKNIQTFTVVPIRSDRRPKMLGKKFTQIVNDRISGAGLTALRHNSVFCTGDYNDAISWQREKNKPYVVVPEGPFDFTWCPGVADINIWLDDSEVDPSLQDAFNNGTIQYDEFIDMGNERTLARVEPRGNDNSLSDAIKSGCEIMIKPHSGNIALFNYDVFSEACACYMESR